MLRERMTTSLLLVHCPSSLKLFSARVAPSNSQAQAWPQVAAGGGARSEAGKAAVLDLLRALGEGLLLLCMYRCKARLLTAASPPAPLHSGSLVTCMTGALSCVRVCHRRP